MADEDFAGAEGVPVRASRRWVGDPLPGRGLYQLAQHDQQPRCPVWPGSTANNTGTRPGTCGIYGGVPGSTPLLLGSVVVGSAHAREHFPHGRRPNSLCVLDAAAYRQ